MQERWSIWDKQLSVELPVAAGWQWKRREVKKTYVKDWWRRRRDILILSVHGCIFLGCLVASLSSQNAWWMYQVSFLFVWTTCPNNFFHTFRLYPDWFSNSGQQDTMFKSDSNHIWLQVWNVIQISTDTSQSDFWCDWRWENLTSSSKREWRKYIRAAEQNPGCYKQSGMEVKTESNSSVERSWNKLSAL